LLIVKLGSFLVFFFSVFVFLFSGPPCKYGRFVCVQDDSEGDDFEPADGDLDDEEEDEADEAAESEEGLCAWPI